MSAKTTRKNKADEKNNVFIVEKVMDKRSGKGGRDEFLIQWQGFPESESSWEPRENLRCADMLEAFEKEYAKREKPNRKRRNASPGSDDDTDPSDKYALNGKQLRCIVGLTKGPGELHFLCKFSDDSARLLPAKEVNSRYPTQVIKYYESKLTIEDSKSDDF
ncbi:unnamed protein product [Caenorhabditis sp. 36 PRJEB53466]|nr:unnamed protein product [Caenorhabditis sp. 36 PRJEB53466]